MIGRVLVGGVAAVVLAGASTLATGHASSLPVTPNTGRIVQVQVTGHPSVPSARDLKPSQKQALTAGARGSSTAPA